MKITKSDVFWNYGATFLKIGSTIILFPFILSKMPSETVGIWTVFITITSIIGLLDFGFNPSFTRNITYVFSGVKKLKKNGVDNILNENNEINYVLLKGLINSMRWIYLRMATLLFLLFASIGTFYIQFLLKNYNGNHLEVYISWVIVCLINTYNLYSLYFESLLQGSGLIKKSKQIFVIGQFFYLAGAIVLVALGQGLIAIVSAQALSVIIVRILSYKAFFTLDIKLKLLVTKSFSRKEVLSAILPNSVKLGITSLGSFFVLRSSIILGSLYLPLNDVASYGITMQLISVIGGLAGIYIGTYLPKITQHIIFGEINLIKKIYIKGLLILVLSYLMMGLGLLFFGQLLLNFIGSQTNLLAFNLILLILVISFLENNHAIAGAILLTNNEVPFFKQSLIAGLTTVFLLIIMLNFTEMNLWAMVLAPGIAQLYNNWKWPYEVKKQLKITLFDIKNVIVNLKMN
jgi:O-antigen/teichoic acid export membrane protein